MLPLLLELPITHSAALDEISTATSDVPKLNKNQKATMVEDVADSDQHR